MEMGENKMPDPTNSTLQRWGWGGGVRKRKREEKNLSQVNVPNITSKSQWYNSGDGLTKKVMFKCHNIFQYSFRAIHDSRVTISPFI